MLNLPARAAQGCSHEENDNTQWLPMNILGVSESGDVLLTSVVDFKHPSALGANVQEPGQGGLLMDAALLHASVWGSVRVAWLFIPGMWWQEWSWGLSVLAADPTHSRVEGEGCEAVSGAAVQY